MESVPSYQNWIDAGYESFSHSGPDGIKVQALARKLGVSKSSFYYYFGDQEAFIELLLNEHAHIAEYYAADVKRCKVLAPDFIDVLIKYKLAIFFQRQLRFHSEEPGFQRASQKVTDIIAREVLEVWARYMEISSDLDAARGLYMMVVDVFYERMREDSFNKEWLYHLLNEIVNTCKKVVAAKRSP